MPSVETSSSYGELIRGVGVGKSKKKRMPKKMTKTKKALSKAGKEMKKNPPKQLAKTKKKFGAARAEKQRKAILLNKGRKAGAKIPYKTFE